MDNNKKLLIGAAGLAAAGAVLYYISKQSQGAAKVGDGNGGTESKSRGAKITSVDQITKEQVLQILDEIIKSQEQMKHYMKTLTQELLSKSLTFDQTYSRVKEVQPSDPLEKYSLTMTDFDNLLDKHQGDPHVREAIAKIMGAPSVDAYTRSAQEQQRLRSITVETVIDVHSYMLEQLEVTVNHFESLPGKSSYDMKTVTIVAQAIVGSKIEAKFHITSEDIESVVLSYHSQLATNQEFASINQKIQFVMSKLMGTPVAAS